MTPQNIPMTLNELTMLSDILWELRSDQPSFIIRDNVIKNVTELLRADIGASFVWHDQSGRSKNGVSYNIPVKSLQAYDEYYCHIDVVTSPMRRNAKAACVDDIVNRHQLEKTEFYHDFVKKTGMYHGVNVFFFRNNTDVGDLRIWRTKDRPAFTSRELDILHILTPYFTSALMPPDLLHTTLTQRENQIVKLVAQGYHDKEIARSLGIAFTTVRTHINSALEKLECTNRTQLASRFITTSYPQ